MKPPRFRTPRSREASAAAHPPSARRIAAVLAAVLAVPVVVGDPAAAAPTWKPATPQQAAGIPVKPLKSTPRPTWTAAGREVRGPQKVTWPAATTARVDLGPAAVATRSATNAELGAVGVRVAESPVSVAAVVGDDTDARPLRAPSALRGVDVQIHDQKASQRAGVSGLLLQVRRADGVRAAATAAVTVDYAQFAHAYGGDWATRLRLVALPACALTTPRVPACGKRIRLQSMNDPQLRSVTAIAPLSATGATVLALSAGSSGDNGDYTATSLSPASTWNVSAQTGAFTWSYPLRMVPGVGGPEPSLSLSYSSQAIDGRTGGTNTQGGWIGDGWEMWPGYIERSYQTCSEDQDAVGGNDPNNKDKKTTDQCWFSSNATMSLNGRAIELVDAGDGRWKGVSDDSSRIELLNNTSFDNGDDDGEYWRITMPDGIQYFFGRNHGAGGATADTATNAVWTTQVYGNHLHEPGYTAGNFAASRRTQAWRWNLDYVVDPNGNTMTMFYEKESGAYGREYDTSKRTTYDRGGWLRRIEYGSRVDAAATTYPAARVEFEVKDRCIAGATCYTTEGVPVEASWPDTPWDQYCQATPCTDKLAPTYWSQKRLSKITTQVLTGASSYSDVDVWTLRQEYLNAGSTLGEGIPMYLRGLGHSGVFTTAGGAAQSDPEITFDPGADPFPNRVDGPEDDRTALKRWRIRAITTESGNQIVVTFKGLDCTRSALPQPHSNTKRCFPQYYAPEGAQPTLDWFHKYVVSFVDANDNTGASEAEKTYYDYLDAPAWHYDNIQLVKEEKRTWGQFRGYGQVKIRVGLDTGTQSTTEYRYLRGMDGDKQPNNTTRDVNVQDSFGGIVEDHDAYAGMLLQETTFNGATGPWVSGTINTPTAPIQSASANSLNAWVVNTARVRTFSRTATEADGVRWTDTQTKYNGDNLPEEVNDLGDESTASDDVCHRTWYARHATATGTWMLDRVKREQSLAGACTVNHQVPRDLLSEQRTTYDKVTNNWDTDLPVRGLPVKVEEVDRWSGTTPIWEATAVTGYDVNGRATSETDALNRRSSTTYTPPVAGPVTRSVVTNPIGYKETKDFAVAWNEPTDISDSNNAKTKLTYDGMGRLTGVWLPGRDPATQGANSIFDYRVRNTKPSYVTTKTLLPNGNDYKTTVRLFDGAMRQRQTQMQAPGGGRVLQDTIYNSRGLVWWKSNPYHDTTNAPVDTELVGPTGQPAVPALTAYTYDGAGRTTAEILLVNGIGGQEKWRTTTTHNGDLTIVVPPTGGTKTAKLVDARGNTIEVRQYRDATNYDTTRYSYNRRSELESVVDSADNRWSYDYDQRGHRIRDDDPDKGTTLTEYDLVGNVVKVTDARGVAIATTYDNLGRKTSLREGSVAGPKRAEWVYDTLPAGMGKLSRSIRYVDGKQYVAETAGYDASGRPTGTKVIIPSSEGTLCASTGSDPCVYTFATAYKPNGQQASTTLPAVTGDLAAERLLYGYDDVGSQTTITSGLGIYVYSAAYDKVGRLVDRTVGRFGKRIQFTYGIEDPTGRLSSVKVSPEGKPVPAHYSYSYDHAGNMTKLVDTPYGQAADNQCYTYDHLRRLVEAWTPGGGDCSVQRDVSLLGGPAPYWHSYEYGGAAGSTGSRTKMTSHTTAGDIIQTYRYPEQGGPPGSRPHALESVTTQRMGQDDVLDSYIYDSAGRTSERRVDGRTQTLAWDSEGRLSSVTEPGRAVSYLYDADGNRLLTRDPQGSGVTLHLPGGMEVTAAPGVTSVKATRYYVHNDQQIAVRTKESGLQWLGTDHHGTAELLISAADLSVQRRRTLPFGEARTDPMNWVGSRSFVGGSADPTGLIHLGEREYDPSTGRFISVDPIIDFNDPQQIHGYSYSNSNPATYSDAGGMKYEEETWAEYSHRQDKHEAKRKAQRRQLYEHVYNRYFRWSSKPSGSFRMTAGGAGRADRIQPGNGIIVVRVFIKNHDAGLGFRGDGRDFSTVPNAGFRVSVVWNTETGQLAYESTKSCYLDGTCGAQSYNDATVMEFRKTDTGGELEYGGRDALAPWAPAVNGKVEIGFEEDGVHVSVDRDGFPHLEVIQYKPDADPMFLARDRARGGPVFMAPFVPNTHERWIDGTRPRPPSCCVRDISR